MKKTNLTAQDVKLFSYSGSKAKYQEHFNKAHEQINVKKVHTYIEAFSGTLASMFHNLSNVVAQRIIINDINKSLINLYRQIKANPNEVIETFKTLEEAFQNSIPDDFKGKGLIRDKVLREDKLGHLKDFYNQARVFFNKKENTAQNAGVMVFMLNHNFNGLYGEAKKSGNFNIAFNWNMKHINIETITNNINNLHSFFVEHNVIIENLDVNALLDKYSDQSDTLIYLDPPYTKSDVKYSANQMTDYSTTEAHLQLLDKCKAFNYVLYSNNVNLKIEEVLDFTINFSRTNGIAQNKDNSSKEEILGFIDNSIQETSIPTVEKLLASIKSITPTQPINNTTYQAKDASTLKCATAFSGIGAAEEALKNINLNHSNEFIVEIDKHARETFVANHKVKEIFTDITKIDPKKVPNMDLFVFGSPCQSYSIQGQRRGLEDTRGTLVYDGLRIIQAQQPKYFIYENVKGMINHDYGNSFEVIKAAFEELNYNIQYQVLNAKHYGAAQNRERLFIVGIRKDIEQTFTFPKPNNTTRSINDFISNHKIDYSKYLYSKKGITPFSSKRDTDIKKLYVIPHLKYEYDKKIYSSSGISPCLTTGGRPKFYDEKNKIFRYLTEQELKEIQGFNKDFKFPVSNTQIRKQIGNSIYVGVLEAILRNLIPSSYYKSADTHIQQAA